MLKRTCTFAAAFFLMLWASAPSAQTLPGLFDVVDVRPNDVLNIRTEPTSKSPIVAAFKPNATGIEVVARQGKWGLVNTGEQSGWVFMRYLQQRAEIEDARHLDCFGTEPFWNLNLAPGRAATFNVPQHAALKFALSELQTAYGTTRHFGASGQSNHGGINVFLTRGLCSDGMSDRSYGLSAGVMLSGSPPQIYAGCCTLARP